MTETVVTGLKQANQPLTLTNTKSCTERTKSCVERTAAVWLLVSDQGVWGPNVPVETGTACGSAKQASRSVQ